MHSLVLQLKVHRIFEILPDKAKSSMNNHLDSVMSDLDIMVINDHAVRKLQYGDL